MSRFAAAMFLLSACSGPAVSDGGTDAGADAGPRDWPEAEVPSSTEPEPGIFRDVFSIPAADAPPNPDTGDDTPSALDRVQIVRFRGDAGEARAIVVAMPGLLGGAGSFELLARHIVRRSVESGEPIEVWAIDRRANLLEDLRGLDAAEATGTLDVARGYYFDGETVGGAAFEGFVAQQDVPFMSEWGLAVHLEDVRAVIETVPASERRARVFLMGHSLGASMTEAFAAWRFEDARGSELLAGIVLIDGAISEAPIEETAYLEGTAGGLMSVPGLTTIRAAQRYLALPILGVEVHARAEMTALGALIAPDDVEIDRGRASVLATLMSLPAARVPSMTNAAAFGWGFDAASNGLSFAAVSAGQPAGGSVEEYESLFGSTLTRPSDPEATYTWIDALDATPPELTPLANLAHAWVDGRTNFAEWYFPLRLLLDVSAVGGLATTEGSWQASRGLRAFDGSEIDAPVLAVGAALAPPERYDASRARMAPVGADRPNAGATRDTDAGFRVIDATHMTHIDPLTAADGPANPVPAAIVEFVLANASAGRVTVSFP
jgi:hypothetical protein